MASRGAHDGPLPSPRFDALHLTSVHAPFDVRIFRKECRTLAAAGYRVGIVVPGREGGLHEGVWIEAISPASSRLSRMFSLSREVWRTADRLGARLYHFHDPELLPGGMSRSLRGVKVVYDAHENLAADIRDKPWISPALRPLVAGAARLGESSMARRLTGVVAATPAIARQFPVNKRHLLQNFPLLSELVRLDSPPYASRPRQVAYVGGIQSVRGAEVMVDAAALLPAPFALHWAGRIEPSQLRDLLMARPGWPKVIEHGWLGREEVSQLLGQSRAGLVLFQPIANHIEAQPNKLFEYMSAGLPIVASDFPLWREVVLGAGCGLVVDPGNPAAVADAIGWLLDHPSEAEAMGQRGRAAVVHQYNWESESRVLLELYRSLLGGPSACAA